MTLVVDASVAAKWVLLEDGSERAAALRDDGEDLIAPSLIVAELGNAIWKRAVCKELTRLDAIRALRAGIGVFAQLIPLSELAVRATEIAIDLRHPIYDCFYLALAERERCALVTADHKLATAAGSITVITLRPL